MFTEEEFRQYIPVDQITIEDRLSVLEHQTQPIINEMKAKIIEKINLESDDVLVLKIPMEYYDIKTVEAYLNLIMDVFPQNKVIAIPNDFEIEIYSPEQANLVPATNKELQDFLTS